MASDITRPMIDAALAATDFANGPTSRRWMAKALAAALGQSIEAQDRRIAELEADVSSYQGLLDAAIDDYNNARNMAFEEAAKVAETAQISGSLVRPGVAAREGGVDD